MAALDAHLPQQVPIAGYGHGFFHFAGMASSGSIMALPSGIYGWPAIAPAQIDRVALEAVFSEAGAIELLIIGTGADPWALPESLRQACREAGFGVDAMPTRAAASTYNVLLAEGRPVAAALLALP